MNSLIFIFILLAVDLSWIEAQEISYQEGTIDLTGKVDLKMVFDGGLRPKQTSGLETTGCHLENFKAKIIFPNNRVVDLLVERGDFAVDIDQNLVSMDFYGPFQPINQAIDQAEQICQTLSLDPGSLESIRANPGSFDHPVLSGWGGDVGTSQYRVRFMFRNLYHYQLKGAELGFAYRYKYASGPPNFSATPIKPPTGYENFSMTPPEVHPTGPAFPPLTFEQAQAIAEKTYKEEKDKEAKADQIQFPASATAPSVQPTIEKQEKEPSRPGWVILLILLTITLSGLGLWKLRQK